MFMYPSSTRNGCSAKRSNCAKKLAVVSWIRKLGIAASAWITAAWPTGPQTLWGAISICCASASRAIASMLVDAEALGDVGLQDGARAAIDQLPELRHGEQLLAGGDRYRAARAHLGQRLDRAHFHRLLDEQGAHRCDRPGEGDGQLRHRAAMGVEQDFQLGAGSLPHRRRACHRVIHGGRIQRRGASFERIALDAGVALPLRGDGAGRGLVGAGEAAPVRVHAHPLATAPAEHGAHRHSPRLAGPDRTAPCSRPPRP